MDLFGAKSPSASPSRGPDSRGPGRNLNWGGVPPALSARETAWALALGPPYQAGLVLRTPMKINTEPKNRKNQLSMYAVAWAVVMKNDGLIVNKPIMLAIAIPAPKKIKMVA